MYEVIREMCAATDMEVKMIRVTGRVVDTYHARIYLAHVRAPPCYSLFQAARCSSINFILRLE
jgi:hypothetical protein